MVLLLGPIAAVVLLAAVVRVISHRNRRKLIERIRAEWGRPIHRRHRMDAIAKCYRSRLASRPNTTSLDERTSADLNLDDVFTAVDRTVSTLGQEALYCRLHTAPVSLHLGAFEEVVTRMSADIPARERAQVALSRLQDPWGYDIWWVTQSSFLEERTWYWLFPWLTATTVTLAVLALQWPILLAGLVVLLAVNLAVRLLAADRVASVGHAFGQIAPIVTTGEDLLFLQDDSYGPGLGAIRSDVSHLGRLRTIARWLSGELLMTASAEDGPAMALESLGRAVYEYLNLVLLLDGNLVYFGTRDVHAHGESLLRLTSAIGDVDAAISVASFRAERDDWTRPQFTSSHSKAILGDVRHPLVPKAVPNTITLEPGCGIIVTGSNMSGKSTFLRTLGVTTVMAQTINTCLASRYEAPILHVQSCIGRADDLISGKSYYLVEVESVLSRVRASQSVVPHMFLFDELFRGTNAIERIAAGEAVLRELIGEPSQRKPHVVVAATHDAELVELLHDSYAAYHFTDTIGPEGLMFDYRLESGPATTRNAIALLELHNAPRSMVERALVRAAALDRQRGTTVV